MRRRGRVSQGGGELESPNPDKVVEIGDIKPNDNCDMVEVGAEVSD